MYDQYVHWHDLLVDFAKQIGKPDPEDYVDEGGWKARQGGNGLAAAQTSIASFEQCATDENAFNYDLQRPITEELYELFKPFGYINKELGNKRLGEVYILNKAGKVVLVLQGYDSGEYEDIDRDGFSWTRGEYTYNWDDSEYRREEEEERQRMFDDDDDLW